MQIFRVPNGDSRREHICVVATRPVCRDDATFKTIQIDIATVKKQKA